MKFAITTVVGAMAGLVAGQVALTNTGYGLREGTPFTLTWAGANGPVSVYLEGGPSGNLVDLDTVASGVTDSSISYTPPATLCSNDMYAFKIVDGSSQNYSPQFYIAGLTPCASSTSSSSGRTSSTSTSTSSGTTSSTSTGSTSSTTTGSTSSTSNSALYGTAGTTISASMSNSTTATGSTSSTTMSTASNTRTPPRPSSTISNTSNGQRASYSLSAILLVTVASLLFIN